MTKGTGSRDILFHSLKCFNIRKRQSAEHKIRLRFSQRTRRKIASDETWFIRNRFIYLCAHELAIRLGFSVFFIKKKDWWFLPLFNSCCRFYLMQIDLTISLLLWKFSQSTTIYPFKWYFLWKIYSEDNAKYRIWPLLSLQSVLKLMYYVNFDRQIPDLWQM